MKKKLKSGVDHPRVAQILKRKKERDVIQNRRLDAFFLSKTTHVQPILVEYQGI